MLITLFSAIFAFIFIGLSLNVIRTRKSQSISIGDGGNAALQRAIRAHANFVEYTPMALILILICEVSLLPKFAIISMLILLLAGRVTHALAILVIEPKSGNMLPRQIGMALTFASLVMASLFLLKGYFTV